MNRKSIAQETLKIIREGTYSINGTSVSIADAVSYSRQNSVLITQSDSDDLEDSFSPQPRIPDNPLIELTEESTLAVILRIGKREPAHIGVLNFASAKNPGGGFLNGALAQEESLAIASSLYNSQIKQPQYYETNRACKSMMYTDTAIYSPDVTFFRNDNHNLLPSPVKASVLTLPAVNYGQVMQKGENTQKAESVMFRRMKIALAIFADKQCDCLILGAYGCGVFRNDPNKIAPWWKALLDEYGAYFKHVIFAVLDRSKTKHVWQSFQDTLLDEESR